MDINPKHIAIICNYELLEDRVGGMDYFFWAYNKACKERQIEVDWFFPNLGTHGEYHTFKIIPKSNDLSLEQTFLNHLKSSAVEYAHIITHFVELCTPFFKSLKQIQQSKIIVVDHNPRPLGGYPLLKRLKKRLKGIMYSKYIDVFVGVSEYTTKAILHDFGKFLKPKTQTIYNGVLIDEIIPKATERKRYNPMFLVVSHLRESKGIQDLIEAVSLMSADLRAPLEIDIYGDGPFKATLYKLVASKKLEQHFNFKGSQSNIKALYQQYDYLIQPTHMECFSLSILESLAANIPVITTPVGGNEEVVIHQENGFIFKTKDVIALSKLIEELMLGKLYISKNTRQIVEHKFSIDYMIQNHMDLLT